MPRPRRPCRSQPGGRRRRRRGGDRRRAGPCRSRARQHVWWALVRLPRKSRSAAPVGGLNGGLVSLAHAPGVTQVVSLQGRALPSNLTFGGPGPIRASRAALVACFRRCVGLCTPQVDRTRTGPEEVVGARPARQDLLLLVARAKVVGVTDIACCICRGLIIILASCCD